MSTDTSFWADRYLRRTDSFVAGVPADIALPDLPIPDDSGERVGVVYNDKDAGRMIILYQDGLVLLEPTCRRFLYYRDMEMMGLNGDKMMRFIREEEVDGVPAKRRLKELMLGLDSGETIILPVEGETEQFLDLYSFHNFLYKVWFWKRKEADLPTR